MTAMKKSIAKATEFFRKAAAALRGKAGTLRARLLFLASLRRRAAVLASISRQIRALSPGQRAGQEKGHAVVVLSRPAADHAEVDNDDEDGEFASSTTPPGKKRDNDHEGGTVVAVGVAELASLFREVDEDGGDDDEGGYHYQDWTLALRSLFDDHDDVDESLDGHNDDETSVIDLIRSLREGQGREFKIDDEIDRATDMFITRVHRRMGAQKPELGFH